MPTCNCKLKSGDPCFYNAKEGSLYCGIHKSCKSPKDKPKSPKAKSKSPKAKPKSNCPPEKNNIHLILKSVLWYVKMD